MAEEAAVTITRKAIRTGPRSHRTGYSLECTCGNAIPDVLAVNALLSTIEAHNKLHHPIPRVEWTLEKRMGA